MKVKFHIAQAESVRNAGPNMTITRWAACVVLCASAAAAAAPFSLVNGSAFERRSDFAVAQSAAGSLLLLGGGNYSVNYTVFRDVFPFLGGPVVTPAWSARAYHTAVVLAAGRIIVSGGGHCRLPFNGSVCLTYDWFNENWASDDGGATWSLLSIGAWAPRGGELCRPQIATAPPLPLHGRSIQYPLTTALQATPRTC